jgi:hypothetical protein
MVLYQKKEILMGVSKKDMKKIIDVYDQFSIYIEGSTIYLLKDDSKDYFWGDDILHMEYVIELASDIDVIGYLLALDHLDEDRFKKYLRMKNPDLLNVEINVLVDSEMYTKAIPLKAISMAHMYGFKESKEVILRVIDTFDSLEDFSSVKPEIGKKMFGFWNIESNEAIDMMTIWCSPIQTELCVDKAEERLDKGSKFLVFEVIEL